MKMLILDSGHAEKVSGKQAPDKSMREYEFNNDMQYRIKKLAEKHGISVFLTNPKPEGINEIGLSKRAELANNHWIKNGKPKAMFVSLHANAFKEIFNDARGTETFVANNASSTSKVFARDLNNEVFKCMKSLDPKALDRGVKSADFTVILKAAMPSILVEYAFYSNKEDLKILKNNRDELVEATVKAICKYFEIEYKSHIIEKPILKPIIDKNVFWRVVVASNQDIKDSEKLRDELKSKGYKDAFIVKYIK